MGRPRLTPYLALKPFRTSTNKAARQYVDYDYVDNLSPEDKAYLRRFTQAHYFNNVDAPALKLPVKVKRAIFNEDGARRRCVDLPKMSTGLATNSMYQPSPEDAYIEMIDLKNKKS